jgi:hypothetical protein
VELRNKVQLLIQLQRHETIYVEETLLNSDSACLLFAIQQTKSLEHSDKNANDSRIPNEVDEFDPYVF